MPWLAGARSLRWHYKHPLSMSCARVAKGYSALPKTITLKTSWGADTRSFADSSYGLLLYKCPQMGTHPTKTPIRLWSCTPKEPRPRSGPLNDYRHPGADIIWSYDCPNIFFMSPILYLLQDGVSMACSGPWLPPWKTAQVTPSLQGCSVAFAFTFWASGLLLCYHSGQNVYEPWSKLLTQ